MSKLNENIEHKLAVFIKLPKAYRWTCCEWFYSDIDRVIFDCENDFSLCLKQSFPTLKTTQLNRKQWNILRSMIGKPRRCSDAFFKEERQNLEEKRQKIRMVQHRYESQIDDSTIDLPQEIPVALTVGQRVCAYLTRPELGVFKGTIAAVDTFNFTYRIIFDRASLGTQTISDFLVCSIQPGKKFPLAVFLQSNNVLRENTFKQSPFSIMPTSTELQNRTLSFDLIKDLRKLNPNLTLLNKNGKSYKKKKLRILRTIFLMKNDIKKSSFLKKVLQPEIVNLLRYYYFVECLES
jgi:hypothetical protein